MLKEKRPINGFTPAYDELYSLITQSRVIKSKQDLDNVTKRTKYLLLNGLAHESDSAINMIRKNVEIAKDALTMK